MVTTNFKNTFLIYYIPGIFTCFYFIFISSVDSEAGRVYTLSDDIMISMSYAKTFVQSGELIWHDGGPRVQGYTNFLYTLFLSLIHLFQFSPSFNSLIISIFNAILIFFISLKVTSIALIFSKGNKKISHFLGGLMSFQYPLIFWSLRGYEVGVISLLIVLIIEQIIKHDPNLKKINSLNMLKIYLYIAIGVLIRIDFIVILFAVTSYFLFYKINNLKEFYRLLFNNSIVILVLFILLLFQQFYYGDFLPNTYYLKTGGFSLIEKIPRGVLSSFKILPLLIFIFYLLINNFSKKENFRLIVPIFIISFYLTTYNIYIGGDAWEVYGFANRFITPIIPLIFASIPLLLPSKSLKKNKFFNLTLLLFFVASTFLIQLNVNQLLGFETLIIEIRIHEILYIICVLILIFLLKTKVSHQYVLAILFTLFLSSSHFQYMQNEEVQITSTDYLNVVIGKKVNTITSSEAVVGVFWAGNLSYYIDRTTIDFLGKSDRYIAKGPPVREEVSSKYNFSDFFPGHNKWNFQYSIGELVPDIIIRPWDNEEFFKQLQLNNYKAYCIEITSKLEQTKFPIYIKNNSEHVDFNKVVNCSKE